MTTPINILISSAGRRVSLVKYFQIELKKIFGEDSKVLTTDLDPKTAPACILSDQSFAVGRFAEPDYIEQLLNLCIENKVKLVIPTIDTELLLLAENKHFFQENGIEVLVSDLDFIKTCRDKRLTNQFFAQNGFLIPAEVDRHNPTFPLFIKPFNGSSSTDIYLIPDESKLTQAMVENQNFMFLEYLSKQDYEEYTVDCYYDKNSNLKSVVPRVRLQVRGGEVSKSVTRKNEIIPFIKEFLSTIKGAKGCQTIQLFLGRQNKKIYGIEINPRFGGGYPLSYLAGANYPNWLLKEYLLSEKIENFDDWEENLLLTRYDSELVVHDFNN